MTDLITQDAPVAHESGTEIEKLRRQLVICLSQLTATELADALTQGQRSAIATALA